MERRVVSNNASTSGPVGAPGKRPSRIWRWLDERLGLQALHYAAPHYANTIWYALGGISLAGFLFLALTGLYLSQFYNPAPSEARDSIIYLITQVSFGSFVRSVHFWLANLVVITVVLHMLRIFWAASYKKPRELNAVVGVVLLVLTMAAVFTGTILKWDQEAYEAMEHLIAAAKVLGGLGALATPDFTTSVSLLPRLYVVHISILPGIAILLVILHLILVKYHGISPWPRREKVATAGETTTSTRGNSYFSLHLRKLAGYSMFLAAVAALLALALPAALGPQVTPGIEVTKPPWMFWWLLPLEVWSGIAAVVWVPAVVLLAILLLPFIDRSLKRHILERRWVLLIGILAILIWVGLTIYAWMAPTTRHIGG